ncbi:MAG: Acylphosphatase [Candidatus Nomurabacteria bacterium GW2011_GWA1_37_20]|uniref:Acylphosphatase n=2 Tax=Parcubacteria group TaxID=1794811 RepID=A0A0G0I8M1_9BACT|nr:MAG: Acylphosphatase [Parcubacteria group bacterium GW2011_GWC1_36_9]KKQ28471.1 MAG: Acylphosphatase [Parcubacteria group bacterium GW2011_GWB1_37_13]KKQ33315.1 MAG: Acylphosphatase [Candidatus Nomurabacteria bacterium GW2011_GWA1_37_20]KKQ47335.1 MAG: Acylphosphatase [Candidatus Yanofskybacteria bacterium GW2011_GWC2_37_9]
MLDNNFKLIYHISMIKHIESGIMGTMLGSHSLSWIKDFANRLKIKGVAFIKQDGSIKITAEGEEENLEKFVEEIKNEKIFTITENFYVNWSDPEENLEDFYVLTN